MDTALEEGQRLPQLLKWLKTDLKSSRVNFFMLRHNTQVFLEEDHDLVILQEAHDPFSDSEFDDTDSADYQTVSRSRRSL